MSWHKEIFEMDDKELIANAKGFYEGYRVGYSNALRDISIFAVIIYLMFGITIIVNL